MLFNDRYGMHRLYYHESKEAFYFAAEAKAILAVRPELRSVDPRGLGEFVACGCVLENRTLFEGIHVLPAAAAWVFRNGSVERRRAYFQPGSGRTKTPWSRNPTIGNSGMFCAESSPLLQRARADRDVSHRGTGHPDDHGLAEASPGSLPCYTFGGMFRECQDVHVARQVASVCEQPHEVIPVGEEFLSRFPHYAERSVYLTDGCVDVSRSPDLYVSERAREIAPVRMTGLYGDEILRHSPGVQAGGACSRLVPSGASLLRSQSEGDLRQGSFGEHPLSFAVFRQAPWHHYGILALEQTKLTVRTPFLDNDFVRTVFRAPEVGLCQQRRPSAVDRRWQSCSPADPD